MTVNGVEQLDKKPEPLSTPAKHFCIVLFIADKKCAVGIL